MNDTGCVLFYKTQGQNCDKYPFLKEEDFVLVIMNEGQTEILKKYGNDCICIDETHGLNMYQFNLTTILILDNMREGFPCAFLISNRSDEDFMYIFYMSVKNALAGPLKPKILMTDMTSVFYNAWVRVMDLLMHRLYCTWHVDRAWLNNLHKVNTKERQVEVYKQLRTLLQEREVNAFTAMIGNFVSNLLTSEETIEFGCYFQEHYVTNVDSYSYEFHSYCYRINAGINTNIHIENIHRSIKYIYLNGKVNKRLDKAIHILMKFVRDKLFGRLITLHERKVTTKLKELRKRHKISCSLDVNSVIATEMGWSIPSSSSNEMYDIEEKQTTCKNCKLVCTDCNRCIHAFTCSCLDCSIKWNMCKHIHLLIRFLSNHKHSSNNCEQSSQYLGMLNFFFLFVIKILKIFVKIK
ncbi:uncharacterized protein LOC126744491 [Anthonomus grandis grandis]|uniref:uncharacterized protein LOC126744491 n=1 Tax=Anthonomus grandis grandis TaxID=2921223 RepID=UPI002166A741|nr:uncharacterized protein LOC126744491 [Anthonomus grandis grandis]